MLYEEVFIFESSRIKTIEVKVTERHFAVVLFTILVQGDSNFWACWWNPEDIIVITTAFLWYFVFVLHWATENENLVIFTFQFRGNWLVSWQGEGFSEKPLSSEVRHP